MTGKKKIIDKNLKSLIKNFTRRDEATGRITASGDLIKTKYNPRETDDTIEQIETLKSMASSPEDNYGNKLRKVNESLNENDYKYESAKDYYRSKKKKTSKIKRCRCK